MFFFVQSIYYQRFFFFCLRERKVPAKRRYRFCTLMEYAFCNVYETTHTRTHGLIFIRRTYTIYVDKAKFVTSYDENERVY